MERKKIKLPKFSIVIPSYNKVDYIAATIQSIIDQKYSNLEIIIQDGGSKDGTAEIIREFAKKYPLIIKWVSKKDKGQVDAINTGMRKATGEILAYINADDVYKKGAFKEVARAFGENNESLWLTGYGDIINAQGKEISQYVTSYKNFLINLNRYKYLLMLNYITQPSTFITKEAYKKYGPFTGTKRYVMEYALWLKLGRVGMPTVVRRRLSSFRLTMDNISATSFDELLKIDSRIAREYTDDKIINALHSFHNFGRVRVLQVLKAFS